VCGKATEALCKKLGGKIPIEYCPRMKGPKVQGVNSLLVKDIGSAIRSLVGTRARTFHDLEQSEQWKVWNALSVST